MASWLEERSGRPITSAPHFCCGHSARPGCCVSFPIVRQGRGKDKGKTRNMGTILYTVVGAIYIEDTPCHTPRPPRRAQVTKEGTAQGAEVPGQPLFVKCVDVELDDDLSADSETLYIQICLLNIGGLSDYMPW